MKEAYKSCELCARRCKVNRNLGELGYCKAGVTVKISRAALHMWEEPPISGMRGSGTIFFSSCSLGCVYCQNRDISRACEGKSLTDGELADVMFDLQGKGAHNINFVTPTHFAPSVISSVAIARSRGLYIPTVYNTGSYDTKETVASLRDTVDIYLADMKYFRSESGRRYSHAEDYPEVALSAIAEMVANQPRAIFDGELMKRGVIVRFLLLPGHVAEAKLCVRRIFDLFGNDVYYSLMNQYTPMTGMSPPLDRRVTRAEYSELVDYAARIGVLNGFVQEGGAASESFIPNFDLH